MTEAQRSYLEAMARCPIAAIDVTASGSKACMSRMRRNGWVRYIGPHDFRDAAYQITDAGRKALKAGNGEGQ